MTTFVKFLILGLGAGAAYALFAQGLVLIYKASSIVNFAQGAIGLLGAYVYYELRDDVPFVVAFAAGIIVSGLVGLASHLLVLSPMERRGSSPLQRVIATLGILAVVQQALLIRYKSGSLLYDPVVPSKPWELPGDIIVSSDRPYLLLIGAALTGVLWGVYRYTKFGMATTATAENSIASAALGWSPSLIKAVNWSLGGALAGTAAILLGSLTGLSPTTGWQSIVPALAAAMVGAFRSFPLTFAGGLLRGVLEAEASEYAPKWTTAMPFLVIILLLVARGQALPLRGFLNDRLPQIGRGRPRPVVVVSGIVLLVISIEVYTKNWVDAVTTSLIIGVLALSLIVVTGYAGQISLAQFAMAGIGGLIAGRLADAASWPMLPAMVVAVIGAIVAGVIVGLPALRVRGVNLAIVTLGLGLAIQSVVLGNPDYTGGPINGTVIPPPKFMFWEVESFTHPEAFAYLCLGVFVVSALVVANLRRGRSGRRMLAVRDNERAAASIGVSVFGAKLYAFAAASGLAALGGTLLAFRNPRVNFTQFELFPSITLVMLAVIGGIGFVSGAAIAGSAVVAGIFAHIMSLWFDTTHYYLLVTGILLLLQLIFVPDGAAADMAHKMGPMAEGLRRRVFGERKALVAPADAARSLRDQKVQPKSLEIRNVTVIFGGGVAAVNDVSLEVRPGEVVGLIGPNGAGKTTLIDAATGFVRPAEGSVYLDEVAITGTSVAGRARLGLVRSWQSLELFESMTVLENLMVASDSRDKLAYFKDLVHPGRPHIDDSMWAIINELGLEDVLESRTMDLSYAQRHLVAIARAMASEASVLMLDEPAAGLDENATKELSHLIRRLAAELGMAVLLIEHDVPMVMSTCDRIVVLEQGAVIAAGNPEELRGNPRVVDAYLGTSAEALVESSSETLIAAMAAPAPESSESLAAAHSSNGQSKAPVQRSGTPVLRAVRASAGYGKRPVVEQVDLDVHPGEVVALLGANGAGKSTTMRMLSGVLSASAGAVEFQGATTRAPLHRRARAGLSYVTEERSVFRGLTTEQNLTLGRGGVAAALEYMPELEPLLSRRAGVLSGGEQQMLTLGRSLAIKPQVLLADELSLGLAPLIVQRLFRSVRAAADDGAGVLLVEQQARAVLPFCDRAYVMRRGRIVMSVDASEFTSRLGEIEETYLWSGASEDERLEV